MKKVVFTFGLFLLVVIPILIQSCDADDEPTGYTPPTLEECICGYWKITGITYTASSSIKIDNYKYCFISFNSESEFAMFLGKNIFGSGTYEVKRNKIILTSGFNQKKTEIHVNDVSSAKLEISIDGVKFTISKTNRKPLVLNGELIGKIGISYLSSSQKEITTLFSNKYEGLKTLQYSFTKTYTQKFEYIYTGDLLYTKRYENKYEQTPSISGWNTFDFNTVWIYDISVEDGFIDILTVADFEK